jgi:hypothetical protein
MTKVAGQQLPSPPKATAPVLDSTLFAAGTSSPHLFVFSDTPVTLGWLGAMDPLGAREFSRLDVRLLFEIW